MAAGSGNIIILLLLFTAMNVSVSAVSATICTTCALLFHRHNTATSNVLLCSACLLAGDVILVLQFAAAASLRRGTCCPTSRRTALVDVLDHLAEVVLNGGHGGDDRRRAEAVCDE